MVKIKSIPILNIFPVFKEIGLELQDFEMVLNGLIFIWVNTPDDKLSEATAGYLIENVGLPESMVGYAMVNVGFELKTLALSLKELKSGGNVTGWFVTPTAIMLELSWF